MTAETVWEGADALRPFLVPLESLEPFPGNPRRGDIPAIAASFGRFGQLKPVIVDGGRIVAGHHMVQAAAAAGWTHIARLDHRFKDEDEQRAFLLADNRTGDLGTYDLGELEAQLQALAEIDRLTGTGYTSDDLDGFLVELARLAQEETEEVSFKARRKSADAKEIVVLLSPDQFSQAETWIRIIQKEKGIDGTSEAVFEALRIAAKQLNS